MGRLVETVGKYAENPYYIAQMNLSVYCVEELCFALCQNTFLLDRRILDLKLAKWLDEECGLRELSRELYPLISRNASPSAFVGAILEHAHFATKEKRQEIEELLRMSADMDPSARKKYFADYLLKNKRYTQALLEYEKILEEMPPTNHVMRSELSYNKGVAFCRLFCFEEAADTFLAAYQENPEHEEAGIAYLAALRMSLSEEDYIAFIAEHPNWHAQSLEVEKRVEKGRKEYEDSDAGKELSEILTSHTTKYYETVSKKLTKMRKKYREMVV